MADKQPIVGISDDFDKVATCEKAAQDTLGSAASAERSQPYYLDVTHPCGAKSEARITLTYPALESSRRAAFLVAGQAMRARLARLRRGDETLPAGRLHPTGALYIFADAAAAEETP